tara:strand:- start:76 stop:450 length:375 start_codon:yes stop_codon:yes gene_type:complete
MQPTQPIQHLSNVYVREEDGETYSDEYPYLGEYQDQIPLSDRQEVAIGGAWFHIREKRDSKLSSSDWTQSVDNGLSDDIKQQWQTYRQALRDIPSSYTITANDDIIPMADTSNVVWPTDPNGNT